MEQRWAGEFPDLLGPLIWGEVRCRFAFGVPPMSLALISNVSIVPFVGDDLLLIRLADGLWEMPGGTREPGEHYLETVRRELLEEAGAHLLDFVPFGAWRCISTARQPYRAHLPHPDCRGRLCTARGSGGAVPPRGPARSRRSLSPSRGRACRPDYHA